MTKKHSKQKVLILISHYLPGFRIGGPLKSVSSLVQSLKDDYEFFILSSDRDLGDKEQYEDIQVNVWESVGGINVMYVRNGISGCYDIYKCIRKEKIDCIYLNSLFQFKFSIFIAFLRRFYLVKTERLIIAPRGELYKEALAFKNIRKKVFLGFAKALGVYDRAIWHSTHKSEGDRIKKLFNDCARVHEAGVLSEASKEVQPINDLKFFCRENVLKIVFLSRISKDKNLPFTYDILNRVTREVEFHIYGPVEDQDIWEDYKSKIKELPNNIRVIYNGSVGREEVKSTLIRYDILFLPTYRENFGHVIFESLSVGTPVLISQNTPWRNLEKKNIGWDLDLNSKVDFVNVLERYPEQSVESRRVRREQVIQGFWDSLDVSKTLQQNIELFRIS